MDEGGERVGELTTAHAWCKDRVPRDTKDPHSNRRQLSTPEDEVLEQCTRDRRHRMGTILYRSEGVEFVTTFNQVTAHVGVAADFYIGRNHVI